MRRRHQQSMPFGWIFVLLTTIGAMGGVVTGLSAHSTIRTASVLPLDESQPFERTQSISAIPVRQAMTLASTSTQWPDESALFSPVPAYPVTVAYAPVAAAFEPVATPAEETPEPQAAPQAAAAGPNVPTPPVRHVSSRPGKVLNDAQIASIRKRLNLTPDQEALWPAVETALRNVSYVRQSKEIKVASAGGAPMAYVDTNSTEVQQLKYAALPLIMRLNDDQKREVKSMAYVMGLGGVASEF
jgi:hypothetical protein